VAFTLDSSSQYISLPTTEKFLGRTAIALKFGKSNAQQYVKSEQFLPDKMARK
jgi:hypothetical protein